MRAGFSRGAVVALALVVRRRRRRGDGRLGEPLLLLQASSFCIAAAGIPRRFVSSVVGLRAVAAIDSSLTAIY